MLPPGLRKSKYYNSFISMYKQNIYNNNRLIKEHWFFLSLLLLFVIFWKQYTFSITTMTNISNSNELAGFQRKFV